MSFFSVCIPNFNYENYLPKTLDSVLAQECTDLEIVVADNQSTDGSVQLVEEYRARDHRIKLKINNCNVGFAGNLGKAASMASGQWLTMLSSDDLVDPTFLIRYKKIIDFFGRDSEDIILSSCQNVIDSSGTTTNHIGIDWKLWFGAERHLELSSIIGADVWILDASALLRNSLLLLRTPFAFASTTYSRRLYEAVEGYSQGGIINPDKKFAWAVLSRARRALIIDKPLVSYRVHHQNQNSQQAKSGALKHHVDQYVSTFQIDNDVLAKAGLTREALQNAFIEQDIALRGLALLADGNIQLSKRILNLGKAAYPDHFAANKKVWALRILALLGPIGVFIARNAKKKYYDVWQSRTTTLHNNR